VENYGGKYEIGKMCFSKINYSENVCHVHFAFPFIFNSFHFQPVDVQLFQPENRKKNKDFPLVFPAGFLLENFTSRET
jgi:hypothetical protein